MIKNGSYAKSIKNWLTIVSSVTFMVNTFQVPKIEDIFLYSFTYLSSIGLAFYSLSPRNKQAAIRRDRIIQGSIICIALNIIGNVIGVLHPLVKSTMFFLIKICYLIFSIFAIAYTFKDDSELETNEEKNVKIQIRRTLSKQKQEKNFEVREKKKEEKNRLRKFILNKKNSKENKK